MRAAGEAFRLPHEFLAVTVEGFALLASGLLALMFT